MALVYCYTNKTNGKKYVGITKREISERERSHLYEAYNVNSYNYATPFKRAIRKYGIKGFELEILHEDVTLEEALKLEVFYIKKFKTYFKYLNSNGYNATIGGEFSSRPKGRVLKIDVLDNYKVVETYDSVYEAEREEGKRITEFTVKKVCYSSRTRYIYMLEEFYDKETIEYDFLKRVKDPVVQLTMNGEFVRVWLGAELARKSLGAGNISMCLSGDRSSSGGFRWVRWTDYINDMYTLREYKEMKKEYVAIDFDGNLYGTFLGLEEATKITKIPRGCISKAINRGTRVSKSLIWFYKEEYENLTRDDLIGLLKKLSSSDNRVVAVKGDETIYFKDKVECGSFFNLSSNTIAIKIKTQERVDGWLLNHRNQFRKVVKEEFIRKHDVPLPNNKLGVKHVYYLKEKGVYLVMMKYNSKIYRRRAKTIEEAIKVRDKLYKEIGYCKI